MELNFSPGEIISFARDRRIDRRGAAATFSMEKPRSEGCRGRPGRGENRKGEEKRGETRGWGAWREEIAEVSGGYPYFESLDRVEGLLEFITVICPS